MDWNGDREEECFYDSLDRIHSSSSSSASTSDDDTSSPNRSRYDPHRQRQHQHRFISNSKFAPHVSNYEVWVSQPSSVEERRARLLREIGLSTDTSLVACNPPSVCCGEGDFPRPVSSDHPGGHPKSVESGSYGGTDMVLVHSKLDKANDCSPLQCNDQCNAEPPTICCSSSISSIHSTEDTRESVYRQIEVAPRTRSSSVPSPYRPASGENCTSVGDASTCSTNLISRLNCDALPTAANGDRAVELKNEEHDCNGIGLVQDQTCTVKNLDNGEKFVVKELREDGMGDKVGVIGTGKQLTVEEFLLGVEHSPLVHELMRRQHVEQENRGKLDSNVNAQGGVGSKLKKKGGWMNNIKSVASSVAGYKEWRSSEDWESSSEKGGRRSSSATDDSQDGLFHGPERVRVRQYGKSCKELSALYKSQQIQAHNGSIWSIKFSLDGRYLASAGEDCAVHVWQIGESERKGELLMDKLDDGNLNLLLVANVSPESTSSAPCLEYNFEKKKTRPSLGRKSLSLDHVVMPDTVFALSEKPIRSFLGHLGDVLDLSWSKSWHLLSSSMDKTVRLWHVSGESCLKVFSHSDYVTCIHFNPVDERYFISGSLDAKVRIWNIPDRKVVDWSDMHEMVTAACYTPDGQGALVGSCKGSCYLYNTSGNKLKRNCQIKLQSKRKKSLRKKITGFHFALGSSSEVLVTSADSRVRVIDGTDLVHKLKGFRNTNSQISASLTGNGCYAICASEDSHVYAWRYDGKFRTKGSATVTASYENFHCPDVTVAVPWPGLGELSEPWNLRLGESTEKTTDRASVTWPEEKLALAAKSRIPHASFDSGANGLAVQNQLAWGMVIVTASIQGEIRTFQNFGLPVRV